MIKVVSFLYRNPAMTHEEFVRYWIDVHAPLCKGLLPQMRGYRASFPSGDEWPGNRAPYDGLIEQWFDDADAARSDFNGPFQTEERQQSSERLIDIQRSDYMIMYDVDVPC